MHLRCKPSTTLLFRGTQPYCPTNTPPQGPNLGENLHKNSLTQGQARSFRFAWMSTTDGKKQVGGRAYSPQQNVQKSCAPALHDMPTQPGNAVNR